MDIYCFKGYLLDIFFTSEKIIWEHSDYNEHLYIDAVLNMKHKTKLQPSKYHVFEDGIGPCGKLPAYHS
jgi:4-hydroxy-L-threonine phosphate dehydrogenase PdxA